jgi:hypothetical protein
MQSTETILESINPSQGWIIGGMALLTESVSHVAVVDLSWAELLYSIAAVIYAVAALVKSARDRSRSKPDRISSLNMDEKDTVDIR